MKKLFVYVALMLHIVLLSLNIQAQTADEIIEKYITAIGGKEKWKQVKSMKVNGFIEVQGIKINFTQQAIHNVGVRVDAEFQGQKIIDITTPTKGWSQNPFGGRSSLQPISEEELKQKLDELDIQDEFIDYATKGSAVDFLGKDEEDGNEFYKVKMTTKKEMKMVTKVFDYKTIPFGIKIPHKSEQMGQILVTDKIEVNTTIDENIFKGN